jgi:hypothetical protein
LPFSMIMIVKMGRFTLSLYTDPLLIFGCQLTPPFCPLPFPSILLKGHKRNKNSLDCF